MNDLNLCYRNFEPKDRDVLVQLVRNLYEEDPEGQSMTVEKIDLTIENLMKNPQCGTILMIEFRSQVIGYALLVNFWSNEYGGNILHIDELYIIETFRSKGIGSHFISHLTELPFNNAKAIKLEITSGNIKARKLYERLGFRQDSNRILGLDL